MRRRGQVNKRSKGISNSSLIRFDSQATGMRSRSACNAVTSKDE